MNFCKDCKYRTRSTFATIYDDRCKKYILHTDVVKGYIMYRSCDQARSYSDLCGHEGKDFDPKPTLIQRIKFYLAPTTK